MFVAAAAGTLSQTLLPFNLHTAYCRQDCLAQQCVLALCSCIGLVSAAAMQQAAARSTFSASRSASRASSAFSLQPHCSGRIIVQVVGSHELSSEARDKAAKRREQLAAAEHKITASERLEAQQQKRQEKKDEEKVM